MGSVHVLPGSPPPATAAASGPTMSEEEVVALSGGYVQPARQLQALHERGFSRAYISTIGRKRVVLERAHADAVQRGEFGAAATAAAAPAARAPLPPNRAGYRAKFRPARQEG